MKILSFITGVIFFCAIASLFVFDVCLAVATLTGLISLVFIGLTLASATLTGLISLVFTGLTLASATLIGLISVVFTGLTLASAIFTGLTFALAIFEGFGLETFSGFIGLGSNFLATFTGFCFSGLASFRFSLAIRASSFLFIVLCFGLGFDCRLSTSKSLLSASLFVSTVCFVDCFDFGSRLLFISFVRSGFCLTCAIFCSVGLRLKILNQAIRSLDCF